MDATKQHCFKVHVPFRSLFTFLEHLRGLHEIKKWECWVCSKTRVDNSKQCNEKDERGREKPALWGGKQEMATLAIEVPEIPLDELVRTTNNFSPNSFVREGSHARIYYAVLENRKQVEIKKLDKPLSHTSNDDFLIQLAVASRLKHKNFVKLLGYYVRGDLFLLAYEFAANGSLHDILHGSKGVRGSRPGPVLSWTQRVRIALDAAKGLQYLHEKVQPSIVHMDIRSSNVLLFHNFRAKIAGYDLFKQAPDMISRLPSTRKSDVYSFGVVLLEILTGRKPIDETMPRGSKSLVTWAMPRLSSGKIKKCVDPRLKDDYPRKGVSELAKIALRCLQFEPELRPQMSWVVKQLQLLVIETITRSVV